MNRELQVVCDRYKLIDVFIVKHHEASSTFTDQREIALNPRRFDYLDISIPTSTNRFPCSLVKGMPNIEIEDGTSRV